MIAPEIKTKIFGSTPLPFNFWEEFEFCELTINMRQSDDPEFAAMLNRIRIGTVTKSDIDLLASRVIKQDSTIAYNDFVVQEYFKLTKTATNTICLFPTNEKVDLFNESCSNTLKIKTTPIKAEDTNPKTRLNFNPMKFSLKKRKNKKQLPINKTAGLATMIKIGIGSRVMLRRNLNTVPGLVNGALGTVTNMIFKTNGDVKDILIQFDKIEKPQVIQRLTADYEGHRGDIVSRNQFPITLAWAITIHKSQGLTLEAVMIDLCHNKWNSAGMGYVALSRCRLLKNIHLIDFNPMSLNCDNSAIAEYNRLYTISNQLHKIITRYSPPQSKVSPQNNCIKRKTTVNFISAQELINNQPTAVCAVNKNTTKKRKLNSSCHIILSQEKDASKTIKQTNILDCSKNNFEKNLDEFFEKYKPYKSIRPFSLEPEYHLSLVNYATSSMNKINILLIKINNLT